MGLKLSELKEKLRQLGQPVSGKKADLATRLTQSAPSLAVSLAEDLTSSRPPTKETSLLDFLAASQTSRMVMEKAFIDLIAHGQFDRGYDDGLV